MEYFYPRPPRGGRPTATVILLCNGTFLSTPSARRATDHRLRSVTVSEISIHALREEGDVLRGSAGQKRKIFLSTPSARRATYETALESPKEDISIHALREEGDGQTVSFIIRQANISIHALREEGDALRQRDGGTTDYISIHALREEGD